MPNEGLTKADFQRAAERLDCEVAAIRAVADVESRGQGFVTYKGHRVPTILFERHKFHQCVQDRLGRDTAERWHKNHPNICNPRSGGYVGGSREHDRLSQATSLNRECGLRSASYGRFQIMGFNWEMLGYESLQDFINAMWRGEGEHLDAFSRYIEAANLADDLRQRDWRAVARGYNGPAYAKNNYHVKMSKAYQKHSA